MTPLSTDERHPALNGDFSESGKWMFSDLLDFAIIKAM
jgi:hypothetical protein